MMANVKEAGQEKMGLILYVGIFLAGIAYVIGEAFIF